MCYTGTWPEAGEAAFVGPWMLIPGDYFGTQYWKFLWRARFFYRICKTFVSPDMIK